MSKYKIELKWALVFFVMVILWMIGEKLSGLHDTHLDKHMIYTNFIALPSIIVYLLALRDKRRNFYQGKMTYGQGFISGLIITAIYTILSPLSQYITSVYITPEYFTNVITYVVDHEMMTLEDAEAQFNLRNYIFQGLLFAPVMGIITSAIVAIFTRKN
jgi:hypothetical protein